MSSHATADIRKVLRTGHGGSGKTTRADAMLFATNSVTRRGSVTDGSSFSDFEKEEKEHKHSIYPAILHLNHLGKRINLIDTPGSPDLIGQAIACLAAVETVVVVINAVSGIEVVTRRMMDAAKERNLPRAIIINKIDSPDIDLEALVNSIRETFGPECLPINLPAGKATDEKSFNYMEDDNKPRLAHVFKVTTDPFIGKLAIFRVHQGKAAGQTQVIIGHSKKTIKLGHVFHLQGKEHKESDSIIAGDIGAVAKIEEIHTGDVLHDDHALDAVHLKKVTFPTPMFGLAVNP